MRTPLVIGNWKMNGDMVSNEKCLSDLLERVGPTLETGGIEMGIAAPAPYLFQVAVRLKGRAACVWGSQDVSDEGSGAFTGEISAFMLKDFECGFSLVGHSERRTRHAETNSVVSRKIQRLIEAGLIPVLCVGESLEDRQAGRAEVVVCEQLREALVSMSDDSASPIVLAYEPVWAIGTGKQASPSDAQQMHAALRETLSQRSDALASNTRIIYGGSLTASNAAALFEQPDIDGGLVGGASLDPVSFASIVALSQLSSVSAASTSH